MTKGLQFIMVELDKFVKEVKELNGQREAWCWFLKYSKEIKDKNNEKELKNKGKDMKQAIKHLWQLSSDEILREQLEAEEKFRLDHEASLLTSIKRANAKSQANWPKSQVNWPANLNLTGHQISGQLTTFKVL